MSDEISAENGDSGDDDEGAKHFWTTLPGLLTGLAALITAVVGAYALFGGNGGDDDTTTISGGSNASQSPSQSQGPSQSSRPTQTSAAPGDVTQGNVVLTSGDYLEFDLAVTGSSAFGEILWTGDNLYLYAPRAAFADANADVATCEILLTQRKDSILVLEDLVAGPRYVCLTTTEDAIVVATIQPPDARRQLPVSWTLSP